MFPVISLVVCLLVTGSSYDLLCLRVSISLQSIVLVVSILYALAVSCCCGLCSSHVLSCSHALMLSCSKLSPLSLVLYVTLHLSSTDAVGLLFLMVHP